MSRINQEVIKAVIEARKVFARQPDRIAYFIYDADSFGANYKRIRYTVIKDHHSFGEGFSIYDHTEYVATFDLRTVDLFEVGLAASTTPVQEATG